MTKIEKAYKEIDPSDTGNWYVKSETEMAKWTENQLKLCRLIGDDLVEIVSYEHETLELDNIKINGISVWNQ